MSVILDNGVLPSNLECAAEVIYNGYLYMDDGNGHMTITTDDHSTVRAVALSSSVDVAGTAKTMTAGEGFAFAEMNCGMVVEVASVDSATYSWGCLVYASDTNGLCDTATSSAVCIGTYAGKDGLQVVDAGELIPVRLNRTTGATA